MVSRPAWDFGDPDRLDHVLGLDSEIARMIASIIIYFSNIEYYLERAIWALKRINPRGIRPETDGKPITELINILENHASTISDENARSFLTCWCRAARLGAVARNNIAHGVTTRLGDTVIANRNPSWDGEKRNRNFDDLWCEPSTLELIRVSLATLLRAIHTVAESAAHSTSPLAFRAVKEAAAILSELSDRSYNPRFEKY